MPFPHLGKSDHDIVSFSMRLTASLPPKVQPSTEVRVRNYAKCNYDLLNADLYAIDWNVVFINCVSAEEHWSAFAIVLNNLLDVHCLLFPNNTCPSSKTFRHPQSIKRLQAHKRRVWRRWRSNKGCDRIRTEYKIASDAYTDAVREFHRDREVNILSSRNSSTFHKFIRRQLKRTEIIPTLIDANNVQIDDCDAKANLFNDFFCSTFTHDNKILPPFPSRVTAGATLLDNILFTPASVSTKLKGLTKSTTLNPDNFPPIVLQSCAHQLGLPLSIIFNTTFERSEFPPASLTSTVLPLFKNGERNQASNHRPISITSSCCKVMESIIHDSMSSYLLSNNLISDSQHGFLKKRSTLSQARSQRGGGQAGMSPRQVQKIFFCPYIIVVWMGFDRDLSDNSYELSFSRVKIVHTKKQNTKLYTFYAHGGRRSFEDLILM